MKIITTYEYPPIPIRIFDWSAIDYETYDGEGPIGTGKTEESAVRDLLEQITEDENLQAKYFDIWLNDKNKKSA
jgi:hypothetical protein